MEEGLLCFAEPLVLYESQYNSFFFLNSLITICLVAMWEVVMKLHLWVQEMIYLILFIHFLMKSLIEAYKDTYFCDIMHIRKP